MAYDTQNRELELQDLEFGYDAQDFAVELLADAFHEHIRQALESGANQAITHHLELLKERLETVLKRITPVGVYLDMSALRLHAAEIHIVQQGISLTGTATGSARLVLR